MPKQKDHTTCIFTMPSPPGGEFIRLPNRMVAWLTSTWQSAQNVARLQADLTKSRRNLACETTMDTSVSNHGARCAGPGRPPIIYFFAVSSGAGAQRHQVVRGGGGRHRPYDSGGATDSVAGFPPCQATPAPALPDVQWTIGGRAPHRAGPPPPPPPFLCKASSARLAGSPRGARSLHRTATLPGGAHRS